MISRFSCRFLILILLASGKLSCETIHTFYGPLEVEEPVLLELIHSPAFQRLKEVHQYGVSYYTKTHPEEYNRFDHSLGVFAVLRVKGASLEEQIAGLLHDVSHTVFSHVGDWVFKKQQSKEDYQTSIHEFYLTASGLETILNRYGYTSQQILPGRECFKMLDQSLPNLCADRIDYNIQGAYFQHFLTREEALELFTDLSYEDGKWVSTKKDLALKLANFSLYMTESCWGSAANFITSQWLADAIHQGFNIGLISFDEFHFGIDQEIWDKLSISEDPLIASRMEMLAHFNDYYRLTDPSQTEFFIKFKCRGVNPWIKLEDKIFRLSSIDKEYGEALQNMLEKASRGWPLEIQESCQTYFPSYFFSR